MVELKRVIEETYTGDIKKRIIGNKQQSHRVGNRSVKALEKIIKAQQSIGKQNKNSKKSRATAANKGKASRDHLSRDLNFSELLRLPPSIIDYDFDVETYEAVVDAFCEVCDARGIEF